MEWAEHTGSGKWWRTQSPGQGLSQNKGWEKPAPAAPGLCSSSAEPPRHWAQPWAAEGPLSEQKLQEHALPSGKHEVLGARQRHCCSATAALSPTPGEEHLKLGKALTGHKVGSGEMSPRRLPQLHLLIPKRDNTHTVHIQGPTMLTLLQHQTFTRKSKGWLLFHRKLIWAITSPIWNAFGIFPRRFSPISGVQEAALGHNQ